MVKRSVQKREIVYLLYTMFCDYRDMGKRVVIFGVSGLMVATSCGFFAFRLLTAQAEASIETKVPAAVDVSQKLPPPVYEVGDFVEVGPIFLPVLGKRGIEQNISVTVVIEVDGKETADEVEKVKPRLADAFIQDLYGALRSPGTGRELLDVSAIKGRIEKKAQEILGDEVVKDVLLKNVTQVPM